MTDLMDQLYSAQQILIPPNLPAILKKYAKAAIRTQPRDLLLWSYYYFKAMSSGLPPPVKQRIEYPLPVTASGLTPGFLKVILNQIGNVKTVSKEVIEEKWESICLEKDKVEMLFKVGMFSQEVDWLKFLAVAAGSIEKNLAGTLSLLCELLTEEPEGGSSMIPIEIFLSLYKYLAGLDCGPVDPFAIKIAELEEEGSQIIQTDIRYSDTGIKESEETWDTLMHEMGQQDSEDTLATDDLREVDSKAGLVVWPDLVPDELKVETQKVSPRPSEEFITSNTGLQVWDEEQFQTETAEKIERSHGLDKTTKKYIVPTVDSKQQSSTKARTYDEEQGADEGQNSSDLEVAKEGDIQPEELDVQHEESEIEGKSSSEESKNSQNQFPTEEQNAYNNNNKPDVNLEFILEPDTSMILVPTPILSKDSICSDQRSIKNVTESEGDPSIGQKLANTASLKDLKIELKAVKRETTPVEWAPGDYFWVHLPGIGPVVPQNVIDEVEVYLRQCAAKQCGMVMPRNLRHFLCPTLDGLGEDVYLLNQEPECLECCLESIDDDSYKVIKLPTVAVDHFIF